jgi:hypothetical protein
LQAEDVRLVRARWDVEMLLRESARDFLALAADVAQVAAPAGQPRLKLDAVLDEASKSPVISDASHNTARDTLQFVLSQVSGKQKPQFVIALDAKGRVVSRAGDEKADKQWGDDLSGYFLVKDALRGYLRDDLWLLGEELYRVAAAPVIERARDAYVGAVVIGHKVDLTLAKDLDERVEARVAFFVQGQPVATSISTPITKDISAEFAKRRAELDARDADGRLIPQKPFTVTAGAQAYEVAIRRLPGEVGAQDGFYAVFAERPAAVGFLGTLGAITKDDISLGRFPWIPLGAGFVVVVLFGMVLMWLEADRPLRRLVGDAVVLGKGEASTLTEDRHKGKFGSIARSVNIALEKLVRESRAAKKDLGAVLGPPPEDGIFGASAPRTSGQVGVPRPSFPPPVAPASYDMPPPPAALAGGSAGGAGDFDFGVPPPPESMPLSPPMMPPAAPPLLPFTTPRPPPPPILPRAITPPPLPAFEPYHAISPSQVSIATRPLGSPMSIPPMVPEGAARGLAKPQAIPRITSALMPASPVDDDFMGPPVDDDLLKPVPAPPVPTEPLRRPVGAAGADFGGATVVADPAEDLLRQTASEEESAFRQVFAEFVDLKERCGETIDGFTYEKFSVKLRQNRDQLISKYSCRSVRFQVYVKDGKAALKATPVKG